MSGRNYSARVMRFRRAVYASRGNITPGCQVLLLRLSDDMSATGIVSIPRTRLADEFACAPARITEWVNQAKTAGFLSVVRRARPDVTAVYQGLCPTSEVREGVPQSEVRETEPFQVREGVPQNEGLRYARAVPQEGVPAEGIETVPTSPTPRRGSNEEQEPNEASADLLACEAHGWGDCRDRECMQARESRSA